jgi:hypothetical protein
MLWSGYKSIAQGEVDAGDARKYFVVVAGITIITRIITRAWRIIKMAKKTIPSKHVEELRVQGGDRNRNSSM